MIEIKNISKSFRNETVLKEININFEQGKIHGIIGKNGSGKTVLFKLMCGYIKSDVGTIAFDEQTVGKDIDFPISIGVIIESPGFLPHRSGYDNLEYLASIKSLISKNEISQSILKVGLDPLNKKKVGKYSLGMKQRLGIAQAIMENPETLILDEPMNALDEKGVQVIRELLLELKSKGKTIIIASHNKEDIDGLCDNVYELTNGNAVKIR